MGECGEILVVRINITLSEEDFKLLNEMKKITKRQTSNLMGIALNYYYKHGNLVSPLDSKK